MSRDRDVAAFDRRAARYDEGPLGRWHRQTVARVAAIAREVSPDPARVLDVGCGTGALLALLPGRRAGDRRGVRDGRAGGRASRPQMLILRAYAEGLPFADDDFDLVVSSLSFDHWADQARGIAECARVLAPGGRLVLADLAALLLWPTTVVARRGRARTRRQVGRLLAAAGLVPESWRRLDPIVAVVVARAGEDRGRPVPRRRPGQ